MPELEAMVAEEPLREERWRLLALALYRAHRQADALAALRRARATLADELGVDPGPALRELEQQVLAQSPALAVPAPAAARGAPGTRAGTPSGAPDDLVDRDRELRRAAAGARRPRRPASRGCCSSRARPASARPGCSPRRAGSRASGPCGCSPPAAASWRGRSASAPSASCSSPSSRDPERRDALLAGAAASARGVFDLAPGESAEGSFAVLHGLYWLAVNLSADGPLVLAVDDLQWCDSASLRFLAYLVRRLDAVPVLVVGTVRTGEQHADEELLAELVARARRGRGPARPRSRPRRPPTWCERRLGGPVSPLFVAACHRTTSGNPLLLRQLLRGLEADGVRPDAAHADSVVAVGSRAVSSMVLMRLRRLPSRRADVARAAAVLGDGAALPVVAGAGRAAGGRDRGRRWPRSPAAEIVKDEQPLAFVHPLVRDAVYRDLPAAERGAAPRAAAARCCGPPAAADEQVAAHLLLAPSRGDAGTVEVLRGAARTAADRGASDSAVTYLRRALAELPGRGSCGATCSPSSGMLESLVDGAASAEHLLQAYALHRGPAGPRRPSPSRSPAPRCSPARRAWPRRSPGRPRPALPPELADQRQALLAHRADQRLHARPRPRRSGGRRTRRSRPATGTARGCWPPRSPSRRRSTAPTGSRAVELARFALEGDRLWPSTTGCSGSWPPTSGCSPTTTSATSGRGPGPQAHAPRLAVRGAVDQPVGGLLALAAGRAGRGAGLPRPRRSSRTACGAAPGSASRTPGRSRSAATSTAATSPPPARSPTRR